MPKARRTAVKAMFHHGDASRREFPMISHLGDMLSLVVGEPGRARKNGEDVFGLSIIGDGGTSTGDFHESLNIASVRKVPVLFLIENNHYAYSFRLGFSIIAKSFRTGQKHIISREDH